MILKASQQQEISIYLMSENDDTTIILSINNFLSDIMFENIDLTYNEKIFNVVVDKSKTTKENICISTYNICENDEFQKTTVDMVENIENIATLLVRLVLITLNEFIRRNSNELSLKEFGYVNF